MKAPREGEEATGETGTDRPAAPIPRQKRIIRHVLHAAHRELRRAGSGLRGLVLAVPVQPYGTARQRRMYAQREEAVDLVLAHLLSHMDVVSLCVGRSPLGEHYGLRVDTIAEQLGLDQRRVERALRDIHAAGILESRRRDEPLGEGKYRGLTAVRFFAREFFSLIGCAGLLEMARRKEYQVRRGLRSLRDAAINALRDRGRKFNESRPASRSVRELLSGAFRPPGDPEPA